jgi:predicted ABC-type ATPase
MQEQRPRVIVIAGPNGAGKTTTARALLADTLQVATFVNADTIAQGLSGFQPESTAMEAGRIMLARLKALAQEHASFAFETTLAGRFYADWLAGLRRQEYEVHIYYLWLSSVALANARVAERVRQGGHNVPTETISRRYQRSIQNFFRVYLPLADFWQLYDNSETGPPRLIAEGLAGREVTIIDAEGWQNVEQSNHNG